MFVALNFLFLYCYSPLIYLFRISDELLSAAVFQEFLGSVPNPGFKANSMIYGPARSKAYKACDPRLVGGREDESSHPVDAVSSVPHRYRRYQSHRGKNKIKVFHYHEFNVSVFCRLANFRLYFHLYSFADLLISSDCGRTCGWSRELCSQAVDQPFHSIAV